MIVVKGRGGSLKSLKIEDTIERRLKRKGLRGFEPKEPWVTIVVEHINSLNKYLEQGKFFFSDIKKDGVLLYDSSEYTLSKAKELPWEERREVAERDYKIGSTKVVSCF